MRGEVLGAPERRRRWSFGQKVRIVEETLKPGVSVCVVARRHGIAQGLLFTWRRQAREGRLGGPEPAPLFAPVEIAPREAASPIAALGPSKVPPAGQGTTLVPAGHSGRRSTGLMEIELEGGHRIRVDRDVDAEALRRVLDALGVR